MTDIKKGIIDIDVSFNTDSTLIDDTMNTNIETLRKKLELIKEKESEEILLKRKELLKEKFITEILKKPELLLDIKNIKLPDVYEKQFQDFLRVNDINRVSRKEEAYKKNNNEIDKITEVSVDNKINIIEHDKNNKTTILSHSESNFKTSSSDSDSPSSLISVEYITHENKLIPNESLLTINNELLEDGDNNVIENKNKNNNNNNYNNLNNNNVDDSDENSLPINQSTTIRIRPIKIVKKLPPQKTKIPTSRPKSRPVNIPFNVPIKKSDRVEDWALWKNKIKQQPLARVIQGSHKILTTNDWQIVYEELKQYKKIEKYETLKAEKQLSFRQIKKFKAPPRTKTHWDHLLEEMVKINYNIYIN
jgi:hypothetical protein